MAENINNGNTNKNRADNEELKKLRKENSELKTQFAELNAQMKMLMELMANNNKTTTEEKVDESKEMILVGSRAFSTTALANFDCSICYNFECGEEKEISVSDMREILRENMYKNNKALFQKGLFYFADDKNYERFNIKFVKDLSQQNVIRIITMANRNEMIREINELTDNKHNVEILHTFLYMVAEMLSSNNISLGSWKYDNRVELENYVGVKIDDIIANSGMYKALKRMR